MSNYENDYNEENSYCIICGSKTKIFNMGGCRLQFTCSNNILFNNKKDNHWFYLLEDHFIKYKESKIVIRQILLKNKYFLSYYYHNNEKTNWKTIPDDFVYFSYNSTFNNKDLKIPYFEFINDYDKLNEKVNRLLSFT
jgi:hypothetical protein